MQFGHMWYFVLVQAHVERSSLFQPIRDIELLVGIGGFVSALLTDSLDFGS